MSGNNERRDFLKNAALIGAGVGFVALGNTALRDIVSGPFRPIPHGNAAPLKLGDADGSKMKVVHTVCLGCNARCGLRARVYDNIVYKVDGNPYCMANNSWQGKSMDMPLGESFKHAGKTCLKGQEIAHYAYDPYRVVTPLKRTGKRGEGKFKPISWEQLTNEVTNGATVEETGEKLTGLKAYADQFIEKGFVVEAVWDNVSHDYLSKWAKAANNDSMPGDLKKFLDENFTRLYLSVAEAAKLPAEVKNKLIDPQMPGVGPKSNLFSFMVGRGTEGRADMVGRFSYETIGSPNVVGHADVCQWPKWAGQICAYDDAHIGPDLKSTQYVISWGAQIAESFNPAVPTWSMMHNRKGNGDLKVVWIDPRAHNGVNAYSHRHIMPKPGEDGAIAAAMLRWVLENKRYDSTFLENPNLDAAKADDEVMFSNASHLVVVAPKSHKLYRKLLRASDIGAGGEDYVVVDKSSGGLKANGKSNAAYFLMEDFSGAGDVENELYSEEDNDPKLKFPKKSKGMRVRLSDGSTVMATTSLQLLKDFVSILSVEEWAKRATVDPKDIAETAKEFTSYGKKACIVSYRGAVMHINGVPTAWLIEALNMLNGNIGHKGGMIWKAGTADTNGDAYDFKKGRAAWGPRIIRTQLNYEESPFYVQKKMEGQNPYPAMMPWYKIVGPHYHSAGYMPSIAHDYPYNIKKAGMPFALMTYISNPLYSYPVANEYKEALLDTKRMGLHVSISNTIDDTGYYADYIVPDITFAEGFTGVQALYHFFFYNAIRSAVIEPLTDPIGDGRNMMYETFLVDVGSKLGSPLWGKGAFSGKGANEGKKFDFLRAEDFQIRQIANVVINLEKKGYKLEPKAEDVAFVEKNYPMAKHYKAAVSEKEWPKVAFLLSRGGFFIPYEKHFDEKDHYVIKPLNKEGMVRFYYEGLATRRNPMTGKFCPGHPRYVSLKEAGSWQGYDPDTQEISHPLKLTTYKSALHTQSRTMSYLWAHESMPENQLWINPADAEKIGIVDGDMVKVKTVGKNDWAITINGQKIDYAIKAYVTNRIKQGVTSISGNFGHWCTTGQYKVPLSIQNADSAMLGTKKKELFAHWKMEQLQGKAMKVTDGDNILSDKRRDKGAPFITAYQSVKLASGVNYPLTDIYGCGVAFYDNNIRVEKA